MSQDLRPHETYLEGIAAGELRFQRCQQCAAAVFTPRIVCNHCGSDELSVEVSAGRGTVYSMTAIASRDAPTYVVALIDLDEGFRMMSAVVDMPAEDVVIGLRVSSAFTPDRVVFHA